MRKLSAVLLLLILAGCSLLDKNPVKPSNQSIITQLSPADTVGQLNDQKPRAQTNAVAPTLSGYKMVKASAIYKIYDRNDGDYDYLIRFNIPGSSMPSSRRVWAMAWYGVWYDETSQVQLYDYGYNGDGTYRLQYLFGKGKAWAYGIYMSPPNWALYYRW